MKARDETAEDEEDDVDTSQESRDVEHDSDRLKSSFHVSQEAFVQEKQVQNCTDLFSLYSLLFFSVNS